MMTRRSTLIARLDTQPFDLLVIGGGIVGAAIARDAAMRGLSVALVEQGDFASGTSSKTSKLIHGGLRYLEQGHLRLVFEGLRERQTLRTIAPGFVLPLELMLPVFDGGRRPAWQVNAGLALYDLLALGRRVRPHRMASARRALRLEPRLRVDGLHAAGLYGDCLMDDARLCLATVLQAIRFQAVCCNYVRLRELLTAQGRVCGGAVEDRITGRTYEVRARAVVNAAGPWADTIRRLSDAGAASRLAPTKGSHLLVPRVADHTLFAEARADGRMFFVLPWGEYSLVGTTERQVTQPLDALSAEPDEVGYLLEELNRLLPGSHIREDAVLATYAGARPLLAHAGSATRASREHRIEIDARGLVSVLGGKFTTHRLMAEHAVDLIAQTLRWRAERCLTDQVSLLDESHPVLLDHWHALTRRTDPGQLAHWLARYGVAAVRILHAIDRDATLGRPVCPHHDVVAAELLHAFEDELACTLTDVLARRTRIAWSSCQGLDLLSTASELMRRVGYDETAVTEQVEAYQRFLADGLAFRPLLADSTAPAHAAGNTG